MADDRLDRAERDIQRLFDRQDKQADSFEQLQRDLRTDLRKTEERLEQRISESHQAVVGEILKVQEHLSEQDEVLRSEYRRDDDLIAARFVWPSARIWLAGLAGSLAATGVVWAVLHHLGVG